MHRGDQVMETATFTISQHNMASAKCERAIPHGLRTNVLAVKREQCHECSISETSLPVTRPKVQLSLPTKAQRCQVLEIWYLLWSGCPRAATGGGARGLSRSLADDMTALLSRRDLHGTELAWLSPLSFECRSLWWCSF